MKDNQEKVIKLINKIDELFDYYDIDDIIMSDDYDNNLKIFSNYLDMLFKDGLNNEMLDIISKIDKKEIFYVIKVDEFKNNELRKEIVEYIDNIPLYMDYDLIKKYIKNNYKLAKYVKNQELLLELVDINELVILLLDSKYLTNDFIIKYMKKTNFITEVFLGLHGTNNNIYRYSMHYSNDVDINELLFNQIKDYLEKDVYQYLKASDLVKTNRNINKLVVSINPKFSVYMDNLEYIDCVLPIWKDDYYIMDEAYYDYKNNKVDYKISTYYNIYEAFAKIIYDNFYYSYNIDNHHMHNHNIEEVIRDLYNYPETFEIHEDEEYLFSKQELRYLKRLKNFLNIIGLKDIKKYDRDYLFERARNKKLKKILEYSLINLEYSNLIKERKIDKFILKYYEWGFNNNKYLLVDKDDYLCLIKVKKEQLKFNKIDESMIDYKLLGFNNLNDYKNDLKKKYEIKDNDYIVLATITEIEDL